jgi:hypothetical protein
LAHSWLTRGGFGTVLAHFRPNIEDIVAVESRSALESADLNDAPVAQLDRASAF